jgi:hypothetical protein
MWFILVIIAVILFLIIQKKETYQSDETFIDTIVSNVRANNPNLVPIETVSVDAGVARLLWFDTDDYSGKVIDSNSSGIIPYTKPVDDGIIPYINFKN